MSHPDVPMVGDRRSAAVGPVPVGADSAAPTGDAGVTALPRDIPGLTSLRALAALLVFAYHISGGLVSVPLFAGGYIGVAFFYVLSGFLLTWGTNPRQSPKRYYVRRIARIYPAHIAVWLLVLVLPIEAGPKDPAHAVLNLLLLQAWSWRLSDVFSMNGVTWSLSCELFFYTLFPLIFLASRRWRLRTVWAATLLLYAAAGTVVVLGSIAPDTSALALVAGADPLVRAPEFLLGVAAAHTLRTGRTFSFRWLFPVLLFTLLGMAFAHGSPAGATWFAPIFLVVIVAVAQATIRGRVLLARGWMVYAGKVSFAFYLVHQLVVKETADLLGPGWASVGVALVVSCGLAAGLHHGVEMPAHQAIVSRFATRNAANGSRRRNR